MPRITVGVRIRPDLGPTDRKIDNFSANADQSVLELQVSGVTHSFTFDHVYLDGAKQRQVFQASTAPIVEAALEGYNGTVFAYGQTGAGKTHTMCGMLDKSSEYYGLCALTAMQLFETARKFSDATLTFRLSVMEIYNEACIDLLVDSAAQVGTGGGSNSHPHPNSKLNIIETESGVIVPGLRIMPISYPDEALNLILEAQANRAVAEHQLNLRSSRSHLIYTFYITRSRATGRGGEPEVHQSKLHLVDLAGSERTDKTGSTGTVQKEANYINRSLSYLEQVVIALTQTKREHIPFRQSKLTYLLKDSLGGNGNTYLIACIWPRKDHVWETLSTLRFAARMKAIEMHPIRNRLVAKEQAPSRLLTQQIDLLRKELALRDFVHQHTTGLSPPPPPLPTSSRESWLPEMTKPQRGMAFKLCGDYLLEVGREEVPLEGQTTSSGRVASPSPNAGGAEKAIEDIAASLPVQSLSQAYLMIHTLSWALREACQHDTTAMQAAWQAAVARLTNWSPEQLERVFVGEDTTTAASLPPPPLTSSLAASPTEGLTQDSAAADCGGGEGEDTAREVGSSAVDREQVFQSYCRGAGSELHAAYEATQEALSSARLRQKEIIALLNHTKGTIDSWTDRLAHFTDEGEGNGEGDTGERGEGEAEREAEKKEARQQLQQAKKSYRLAHQEFLICKEQIAEMQSLKTRSMNALLHAFNEFLQSGETLGEEKDI